MSQTSYTLDIPAQFEGMLADDGFTDKMTKENTAVAIPFGKFVVRNADDHGCKLPVLATDITVVQSALGVAIAQQAIVSSASGDPQYPVKSAVPVLKKGRVWVKVEEAVTPLSTVVVRFAAGGLGLGSFGDTAGAAHAALAGAKYLTTAAANGFALLELDL